VVAVVVNPEAAEVVVHLAAEVGAAEPVNSILFTGRRCVATPRFVY